MWVAVDDAGSGYAGIEHILNLRPDVLKLARSLIAGIARQPGRQAMVRALVDFALQTRAELVAEGVEHPNDLAILRRLGVPLVQGYLVARPELPARQLPTHFALPSTSDSRP